MFSRMLSYDNDIDFRRVWRVGYAVSAVLLLLSAGGLVGRGLNLGIDFEGGTAWEVPAPGVSVSETRDALATVGADGAKIQIVGTDVLRIQGPATDEAGIAEVTDVLAELAGTEVTDISISTVGPTWGDEVSDKALRALVFFFVIIAVYISIRLEWKMAIGALAAVVHDIVISVGFYAVLQLEVTPATVISFLTIMGYSMYDTIVVYDKAKENANRPALAQKMAYTDLMSLSLNQVLMRSVNSSLTSLLPIVSMLVIGSFILGATTLQEFAVALAVGVGVGAFSSIFVASPLVAILKEREPQWRNVATRVGGDPRPVAVAAGASRPSPTATTGEAPTLSGRAIPPRPRKKGKRR